MISLVDFLKARLEEDEAAARAAAQDAAGYSHGYPNEPITGWRINDEGDLYADHIFLAGGAYGGGIDEEISSHLVRHDPARVLREVEAKRAIIEACRVHEDGLYGPDAAILADAALQALAAPYSDHSDYRKEWAA